VFVRQAEGRTGAYIALGLAIVAVHFVLYTCMRYSGVLIRVIKESGIILLAKVAGLLLAAIAVELVANSVRGFIAGG
jgi:multiple antibiotic resistance protein